MAHLLLLPILKDVVQVLLVYLHEEYGRVVLKIGQQGCPRALRRGLNLSDDVVLRGRLDHSALPPLYWHVVSCPLPIYSALSVRLIYLHNTRLFSSELTTRSAIIRHWLRLGLLGGASLCLIEWTGSVGLVDFYRYVERIHVPIGISWSFVEAFVLTGERLVLREGPLRETSHIMRYLSNPHPILKLQEGNYLNDQNMGALVINSASGCVSCYLFE